MIDISALLSDISHRPYELPLGVWQYYQEWNNALFLHWRVPFRDLRNCIPEKLQIDSYKGECYISLVAFTMQNIRPKNFPAIKPISDFHEINLRTYIDNGDKKGVYFLTIEAEKYLSAFIAKNLSGLPYQKAIIKRTGQSYNSKNRLEGFALDTVFKVKEKLVNKSALDKWLTERYCLYLEQDNNLFRYDIHHKEWELKHILFESLDVKYKIGAVDLSGRQPDLAHYSDGVKVLAWKKCAL